MQDEESLVRRAQKYDQEAFAQLYEEHFDRIYRYITLRIGDEVEAIFTQVLLICEEDGLLGGTHFSLDGLKLSSNASKEWSGKLDDLIRTT